MAEIDDGGPAFPMADGESELSTGWYNSGMSLRAWLAGQALGGIVRDYQGHEMREARHLTDFEIIGRDAVSLADATIAALKKGESDED